MKIVAIGDIHGRDVWKKLTNEEFDKFIFLGDYFDSREGISPESQIINFNEIIEFKKSNSNKVELLIGNHDYHYINGVEDKYSSFNWLYKNEINDSLQPNIDKQLLNITFVYNHIVFSHAGITKTWCLNNDINIDDYKTLQSQINNKFIQDKKAFEFNGSDRSGNITQSPIWVRIPSLIKDKLDNLTFIIGHSTQKEIVISSEIIAIDVLPTSKEYLIIEDDVIKIGKIK